MNGHKRVLVIKLTSMGDLMHALPALSDARKIWPDISFDWVVDESFAEVPVWHPAVNFVYKSAHRRWRRNFWQSLTTGEFQGFYRQLNENDYDVVIDAQNNVKSAVISLLRRGRVYGMDKGSVAEQPAYIAYAKRIPVDRQQHAIARQRQLFASALGYKVPDTPPEYGLKANAFRLPDLTLPAPYLVFVHNASWTTKLWPESYWHDLTVIAGREGYNVLLPGGSEEELQRAARLAEKHDNAVALPRLSLSELGGLITHAAGAVCCDTGLAHLSAMTGVPTVTLYGPTSKALIGTTGDNQQQLVASNPPYSCAPCYKRTCNFEQANARMSACMQSFRPEMAWTALQAQMANRDRE
jgi:heptosyltransferase-1